MWYRIKAALSRFMYGCYGTDGLNKFLFVVYFVLLILGGIIRRIPKAALLYLVVYLLTLGVMFLFFFRTLSRNHYKRRQENLKYYELRNKFTGKWKLQKEKWQNRKTHVYRTCPNCRATIKLPRKKGKHTCTCPKCRVDFKVTV